MAFNLESIRKNEAFASPRLMVYGVEGIGKSSFAAGAPAPIFIPTEDGLGNLSVKHFPIAKSSDDVLSAIGALFDGGHDFRTVVIDSLDWLETLIWREIESKYDAKDLAYGKGAMLAADRWRQILDGLNALRSECGMIVVLIAHCEIRRFDSPETESYDRYQPKLQSRSSALLREWADAVMFANYRTVIKKDEVGFNKTVARGISTGERLLFTAERPAFMAKNRYALPESIPLQWAAFESAISN